MWIALKDFDFLLRSAQNWKKCTFFDNLRTITQEGNIFHLLFPLCFWHSFLYLKILKIHLHAVPIWSILVCKIQSGPLNCNSEKVLYFLRCKICDDTPYVGKAKTKFPLRFNNYKSKHWSFRKRKQNVPQKRFHSHHIQDCHRGIDGWEVTLFDECETNKQLKVRETFWQHKLKTFYPLGLNENEEYLF